MCLLWRRGWTKRPACQGTRMVEWLKRRYFRFGLEGFMVRIGIWGFWERLQPPLWLSFLISHCLTKDWTGHSQD